MLLENKRESTEGLKNRIPINPFQFQLYLMPARKTEQRRLASWSYFLRLDLLMQQKGSRSVIATTLPWLVRMDTGLK